MYIFTYWGNFLLPILGETGSTIRLVNGATTHEGRVEVFHNDQWGTVCHRYFDNYDAEVICRQLGFGGGTVRTNSFFGAGVGPIWLNELGCLGTEPNLSLCTHRGWGDDYGCSHAYDAGVICDGGNVF